MVPVINATATASNAARSGSFGPFPTDFEAYFPLSQYSIDTAHVDIYLAQTSYCGYCGDGIIQTIIGEQCEPSLQAGESIACCSSNCTWIDHALCDDVSLCNPVFCTATGNCTIEPVSCAVLTGTENLCSFNSCISGVCTVQCFGPTDGNPCCDDGNNCTVNTCQAGICATSLKLECDCAGNPAYNNCFACVTQNATTCGYDTTTGQCVTLNITDLLLNPDKYPHTSNNKTVIAYNQNTANDLCLAARSPTSKVGLIVGVVAGAAVLAAIALVCAIFWRRIKEFAVGVWSGSDAPAGTKPAACENPTYEQQNNQSNVLYETGSN